MNSELIASKIYFLKGERVLLDSDLAKLYGTDAKRLKETVRRNRLRFPTDFMFELDETEWKSLRSQIASLDTGRGKYSKYTPFAFTEQGIAMFSVY